MLLSVLPDEDRTDLTEAGYPGLVAVWRPMDILDKARWVDAAGGNINTVAAQVDAVRRQLLRIEGLEAEEDGQRVPFDGQNPKHFAGVPLAIILPVYLAILERTAINEAAAKN